MKEFKFKLSDDFFCNQGLVTVLDSTEFHGNLWSCKTGSLSRAKKQGAGSV